MASTPPQKATIEDKVDELIGILEHMNRRDKLRTVGGFVRGLIGIIPVLFVVYSFWYFYNNFDALLDTMTKKAAEQAIKLNGSASEDIVNRYKEILGR